jgi:hypothetical protein
MITSAAWSRMSSRTLGTLFRPSRIVSGPCYLDNPIAASYRTATVPRSRRDGSPFALESLAPHARAFRRSFIDEVAIDFPSSTAAIEFFRRDHVEPDGPARSTDVEIAISARQAGTGAMVSLEVRVLHTCPACGGRGEVWSAPCEPCAGQGHEFSHHRLTVSVPAGVVHGDRFSFNVSPTRGPRTRVYVRVAVTGP